MHSECKYTQHIEGERGETHCTGQEGASEKSVLVILIQLFFNTMVWGKS